MRDACRLHANRTFSSLWHLRCVLYALSGTGDVPHSLPSYPSHITCCNLCPCLQSGTDAWRPMRNAFGAAWEASRLPTLPWDIRLTNAAGKTLVLP
jgi:hypothetical protein